MIAASGTSVPGGTEPGLQAVWSIIAKLLSVLAPSGLPRASPNAIR